MTKIALVTGANSGMGAVIAQRLAKEGMMVFINYVENEESAKEINQNILSSGQKSQIVRADITDESQVKDMFAVINTNYGKLDYLINNAGCNSVSYIETQSLQDWNNIISTNLTGKFICSKYAIPLLKQSDDPRIVNIASRFAQKPCEEIGSYCCAESGIVMLTKVLALELSKYDIKVNSISPGLTRTPLTLRLCDEDEFETYVKANPLKRLGTPDDVADTVIYLLSDMSKFITGENINVSGGIILR
jgi:3-oxoacyl-[acyl-carrier protein] reductase